jgi:hypothetical protein
MAPVAFIANIIALACISGAALAGLVSLYASATIFLAIAYGAWMFLFGLDGATRPARGSKFEYSLSPREFEAFRRYHTFILWPIPAQVQSGILNNFRLAGVVWGGLCIWHGMYWHGAGCIAFFFVSGGLILQLSPVLYMASHAKAGNATAIEDLALIQDVTEILRESHTP